MAFDFVTQMNGPAVPINLYSDSARAGIQAGQQLPSTTTAIIQGGLQGIQTGLSIAEQTQQVALRQNAIDQIPVDNQIKQAQLEAQKTSNDINALKLEILNTTKELQIENEKVSLQKAALDQRTKLNDLKAEQGIAKDLSSGDPNVRFSVLNNPAYQERLLRDPNYAEGVLSRLYADPQLTPEQRQQTLKLWDFSKRKQHELEVDKLNVAARKGVLQNYQQAEEALNKEVEVGRIMSDFQLKPSELGGLQIYPDGLKSFKPDGTIDTSKPDRDITIANTGAPGKFVAVYNGKKFNGLLGAGTVKALEGWQNVLDAAGIKAPVPAGRTAPAPVPQGRGEFSRQFEAAGAPQPAGTPSPIPTPEPSGPSIAPTNSPIVNQRSRDLLSRAESDPALMNRLRAKGLIAGGALDAEESTTPIPSPVPAPTAAEEPRAQFAPIRTPTEKVNLAFDSLNPAAKKVVEKPIIEKVLNEPLVSGLPPLYQAVAAVESGGRRGAKAKTSSATGLFQLTSGAAEDTGVDKDVPEENVRGGVNYLNQLLTQYSGNETAALMAYHIGPSVINAAIDMTASTSYEDLLFAVNYMKSRGRTFGGVLTASRVKELAKYPLKVFAYKEAFQAVNNA